MYNISEKNVNGLFNAVNDNDVELAAAYIKDIYVELFDNTQYLDGDELDTFTAQVDVSSDEGVKGINKELKKLYGFCDEHQIALGSDDEVEVVEESVALNERELSTKDRAISKIFVDNKDKINKAGTKEELVSVVKDLLKDVNPERTKKIFAALDSKKDYFRALQYIYDFILKGDDLGVIKEDTTGIPSAEDILKDAEAEADKVLASMNLEEGCFDCCDDDLSDVDDSTDDIKLFDDEDDEDLEEGFIPDDCDTISMLADDDGQRDNSQVVRVNECTPPQFKPANPISFEGLDKTPKRADEIDITVDDNFEADDIDDIEMKY